MLIYTSIREDRGLLEQNFEKMIQFFIRRSKETDISVQNYPTIDAIFSINYSQIENKVESVKHVKVGRILRNFIFITTIIEGNLTCIKDY